MIKAQRRNKSKGYIKLMLNSTQKAFGLEPVLGRMMQGRKGRRQGRYSFPSTQATNKGVFLPRSRAEGRVQAQAKAGVAAEAKCEAKRLEQRYRLIARLKRALHQRRLIIPSVRVRRLFHHFIRFGQWLAGVIDGDGHLHEVKGGRVRLQIVMGTEDRLLLEYVKRMLGGGCVTKKGSENAWRYQLGGRVAMVRLVYAVNGYISNSVRLPQFTKICRLLKVRFQKPFPLDWGSAYFSGFFDADGHIGFYPYARKNGARYPRIQITLTNKHREDLEPLHKCFGGELRVHNRGRPNEGYA